MPAIKRVPVLTREAKFLLMCRARKLPVPVPEYRFHPVRKFRLDWAWPEHRVGLEVDGGVWSGGAHGRGTGITRDQEKTNLAAGEGWRILRCVPSKLATMDTLDHIARALRWRTTEVG
jgi:very-short-patch-repair endonuclease